LSNEPSPPKKWRYSSNSGRVVHAAVRIADAVLEMGEPPEVPSLPGSFWLSVDDCDASYQRAIAAGATSLQEPAGQPDGRRTAVILDPFGYQWITASLLRTAH
jgi:PhnB protein